MAEFIEDLFIVIDVIFTFIAVIFKARMQKVSDFCFMISGVGLMVAFVAMIIKRLL